MTTPAWFHEHVRTLFGGQPALEAPPSPVALIGWPRAGRPQSPANDCPYGCEQWVLCPECDGAGGFDDTEEVWTGERSYHIVRTWHDCPRGCEEGKVFDGDRHEAGCPRARPAQAALVSARRAFTRNLGGNDCG